MTTRTAVPGDEHVLAAMLVAFNREFETYVPPSHVLERRFANLLSRADVLVLLALDPEPVGFALVTSRPSPYYDGPIYALDELYIVPERRGRGLGTKLIEHLVHDAQARNIGEIQINGDEGDVDPRRFYERHGFINSQDGERMLCYLREL